jgi:uncharacterized protein (TIGR00369 family)
MNNNLESLGFSVCKHQQGFSQHIGPFCEKHSETKWQRAIMLENKHLNPAGVVHGGVLLSFADYVIYRAIGDQLTHDISFATINLDTQFLAAAKLGEVLYGEGEITRATRSIIFAQGRIWTDQREIMRASGIWKIIGA